MKNLSAFNRVPVFNRVFISVALLASAALVSSSQLGSSSCAQGVSSARPALLVLNKSENVMAVIDPATLQVIGRVPTGEGPHEVIASADGKFAFVANYGVGQKPGSSLSVIDIAARKEIKRVDLSPLMRPHGITESNGKIYFTIEGSRAVARYDPSAERLDWIMGTGQTGTHMLVVAQDSKKLYTANIGSDTVTMIRLSPAQDQPSILHIAVGNGPEAIALSPDGRELWVGHNGDGGLSIIDTATDKIKEIIKVGEVPIRVKFTPDGKRVLISDARAGEVAVFDAATRKQIKRISVGAVPVGILITPDGRRAFVASTQANKVSILDLESLTLAGAIEPGREPDGMAWTGQ